MPRGAQPDVVGDGSGEQMRILQNHAEIAPQLFEIEIANIDSADADAAALHFIEAQQQAGERGLARAGVAHHRDGLAGLDAEADVAQHPVFVFVGEPDVVEFDGGGRLRKRLRAALATESAPACRAA